MNNNDNGVDDGLDELLDLLKLNPGLMKEIVFNPESIASLLESSAALALVRGTDPGTLVDANTFLKYVAGPDDGYAIAQCFSGTQLLCGKGTRYSVKKCAGGTKPPNR